MNDITIILCAGDQVRFGNTNCKQLLEIEGEKLLFRTIRQIKNYTDNYVVAVHHDDLKLLDYDWFIPSNRKTTCESILSTFHLWAKRTTILLGDVYYTDDAIASIYKCNEKMKFFSDTGDFFAISFSSDYAIDFKDELFKAIKKNNGFCPILELYRSMKYPDKLMEIISDRTQDFDRPHEYDDFLKGVSKNKIYKQHNVNK